MDQKLEAALERLERAWDPEGAELGEPCWTHLRAAARVSLRGVRHEAWLQEPIATRCPMCDDDDPIFLGYTRFGDHFTFAIRYGSADEPTSLCEVSEDMLRFALTALPDLVDLLAERVEKHGLSCAA